MPKTRRQANKQTKQPNSSQSNKIDDRKSRKKQKKIKKHNKIISSKQCEINKSQQKEPKHKYKSKTRKQSQQKDDFMNENSEQNEDVNLNQLNKGENKQMFQFGVSLNSYGDDVQLVAQVSDEESQSQQDQDVTVKNQIRRDKIKKGIQSNNKISRSQGRQEQLQEQAIEDGRAQKNNKNTKITYLDVSIKEIERSRKAQNVLISTVIKQGMVGPYKYYEVRIKNGRKGFIRQKDMILFFPAKLSEFRQRILNKVAKSTGQLYFAV